MYLQTFERLLSPPRDSEAGDEKESKDVGKELSATGFMSNRGRQIVCSFLVRDMGIDWRMGAEWFETCLLDYDPCSNYGNWTYGAGVGNDPREDRYFSIPKQAQVYDQFCWKTIKIKQEIVADLNLYILITWYSCVFLNFSCRNYASGLPSCC